jgi:hypothetical protein
VAKWEVSTNTLVDRVVSAVLSNTSVMGESSSQRSAGWALSSASAAPDSVTSIGA